MLLTADETQSSFGTALVVIVLGGAAIYAFGYVRAVMHRANKDYKTTKAAVPVLRKGYWSAWWVAVKRGTLVMVVLVLVVYVWLHVNKDSADANVRPTPSGVHSTR
jgi:hypothetical protein